MSSNSPSSTAPPTPPQRKTVFRPFKLTSRRSTRKSDGLALLIEAAEAATAAGEFAPFPYIKVACGTFVTLLKAVENVRRNREDLKELCEKIKEIVDILQAQVSVNGETIAMRLEDVCKEFERFLQEMLVAVARMQAETEGFRGQIRGFIKSSSISAEIVGYDKRIQELISNINLITGIDTNFRAIKMESTLNALHAMISPNLSSARVPQNINNCPPATRIFQGRKKILAKMQDYFAQGPGQQHIYVLHGLGGTGKTQIALRFIQDFSYFINVFFLDASTIETIDTGFKNIARLRNTGNSSNDALTWLISKREDWLVFFDNADDPKLDLSRFLPACNHGNIIITTRNPGLRVYGTASQVSDMEEEDAVSLLLKCAAPEPLPTNKESAAEIVKALWYLPLAIIQAGTFIARSGALDRYLALYSSNSDKLMKERHAQHPSDYTWTVYTTWKISFDHLSASAAMFLQLCSFLHRNGISEEIFSRAANYNFPSLGPSKEELRQPLEFLSQFRGPNGEWDTLAFLEVTNEIVSYSLATFAPKQKTFSIHPLVHQWSRDTLPDPESIYHIIHSILGMSIQGIPAIHSQIASLKLLPHVNAVMKVKDYLAPDFTSSYGLLYLWAHRHQEAKVLKISALEKHRTLKGHDELDTLHLMHNLGVTYTKLGELKQAEELQSVVLERRGAILGRDHPETLTAMYNLAVTYRKLGWPKKAEELELLVVEKRRAILGEDHPETLDAMYSLAITYWRLGQLQKAEELGVVVVEKRTIILGDHHPDTLTVMHNLAITYNDLGQPQKAEELAFVVVKKRTVILGEDHPKTLDAMHNLALIYAKLGQFQKAVELGLVVVQKRSIILGVNHLDTLLAMGNLAATYRNLSQFEHAERIQTEVMNQFRIILGDEHPHTIVSICSLALTYRALGKVAKAEKLEESLHTNH
ncbi:hypothetical protein B0H16DRAFT_1414835 [Mycena metata]|uniref:NB-ARC domain-containing protein n=1 Tax=Mycena metata TaxID=1033252 RepID=A0AAD7JCI5_9AGAR|nr:hypothetical protein B0H16DRAFT_1414835 [Mycena metata]